MALWRCAHCGTPQPVAARCWVCRRSSTSCATCRHFRSSVAARIGYCGLDRTREPLTGVEVRSCWDGQPLVLEDESPPPVPVVAGDAIALPDEPYLSGFVLVDSLPVEVATPAEPVAVEPVPGPLVPALAAPAPAPAPDGMLWSELEA